MDREQQIQRLAEDRQWDMAIIGGGATGLGTALDAVARGLRVVLFEQGDFAIATSSRSTKLIHGGVRYLQQGNLTLVAEALRERERLCRNAPHLVYSRAFVVPSYRWYDSSFYGIGLKAYDWLAGSKLLGASQNVSKPEVIRRLPTLITEGLRGGTLYYDGAFDDSRLAISLCRTAGDRGAVLLNYVSARGFEKDADGRITHVLVRDEETQDEYRVAAKCFVNATGPFCDSIRQMDDPNHSPIIAASQGVHIVVERSFLPGDTALLIPRTDDGRVLFAIPWQGATVIGTTDTPIEQISLEPQPMQQELDFLQQTAARYLAKPIGTQDILSTFVGIRPLVQAEGKQATSRLSREHTVRVDARSKLITVAGGKWTTYRSMAEDVVNQSIATAGLSAGRCMTSDLRLYGAKEGGDPDDPWTVYGTDADRIRALIVEQPALGGPVHPQLPITGAEVVWACREEMARTVDDVLARRRRCLLLDARRTSSAAQEVAQIMARELQRDTRWIKQQVDSFQQIARGHLPPVSP